MAIWDYRWGDPRSIVKVDTQYINKGDFDRWLTSKKVVIDKQWFENEWAVYRVYTSTLSENDMISKWGFKAPSPPLPPPTPVIPTPEREIPDAWDVAAFEVLTQPGGKYPLALSRSEARTIIDIAGGRFLNQPTHTEAKFSEFLTEVYNERHAGIREETMEYWQGLGYTEPQAAHLAKWCRDNQMSPSPSTIEKIIAELEVTPETALQKQWREFAENPGIISAWGLMPSSVIESFSRVFTGYSYIDAEPADPRPGDYAGVVSIIAGVSLAALGSALAIMGPATGYTVPGLAGKFTTVSSTTYAPRALSGAALTSVEQAASAATKTDAVRYLATSEGLISTSLRGAPGTASLIFQQIMAMPMKWKLMSVLSGAFLLTQLDATGWFFGLSPEASHNKAAKLLGSIRSDLIRLDGLTESGDWTEANKLVPTIRGQIDEVNNLMDAWSVKFWETFGFSMADKKAMLDAEAATFETYISQYPQLSSIPPTFAKEFTISDFSVQDGDTLIWPGHPNIRIIGIDAHESETAAGVEETEYLKSLVDGKTLTIKTHEFGDPAKTIDMYGRLLAGVFVGDQDIAKAMLEHFGKLILTATKYQDKYRWIDWDEYKRVAEAAVGPAVEEFKILIDSSPSNAKLYIDGEYTHHLTPSDQAELKDVIHLLTPGEHIIKATKSGKEASVKATIHSGANSDIMMTLKTVGLTPEEPAEVPAEAPPPIIEKPEEFAINIVSTPSRAKLYIDGEYTHHLTPSNAAELKDVMHLLEPGEHTIRLEKGGKAAEKKLNITAGDNGDIFMSLEVVGLPKSKEDILAQIQGYQATIERLQAELAAL